MRPGAGRDNTVLVHQKRELSVNSPCRGRFSRHSLLQVLLSLRGEFTKKKRELSVNSRRFPQDVVVRTEFTKSVNSV